MDALVDENLHSLRGKAIGIYLHVNDGVYVPCDLEQNRFTECYNP